MLHGHLSEVYVERNRTNGRRHISAIFYKKTEGDEGRVRQDV